MRRNCTLRSVTWHGRLAGLAWFLMKCRCFIISSSPNVGFCQGHHNILSIESTILVPLSADASKSAASVPRSCQTVISDAWTLNVWIAVIGCCSTQGGKGLHGPVQQVQLVQGHMLHSTCLKDSNFVSTCEQVLSAFFCIWCCHLVSFWVSWPAKRCMTHVA